MNPLKSVIENRLGQLVGFVSEKYTVNLQPPFTLKREDLEAGAGAILAGYGITLPSAAPAPAPDAPAPAPAPQG